ncbi:MAG: SpoIIE family protein phosphatase, partial [Leptospiraceae bacterium]|nr:SpoIIE family protein phosphatase [Leptospiraceae bacterium]
KHYVAYMNYDKAKKSITETGFSYPEYRNYVHPAAKTQKVILAIVLSVILFLFPLFFKGSLLNPLQSLLRGVTKVNKGDLDVVVPIKVQDEIGFLSGSFNSMVSSIKDAQEKLQDYADNLEEKVKERTREVQEKMEEIQALKIHQDGDYYLTSLLTKPLFFNANKSAKIKTDFLIKQKKTFEFRSKKADLGGDICVTGNLKFGTPDNFKRYTMVMNGDAMGKSMQGAGGSLVMGVVMNSIMARSAGNKRILDSTPEQWLTDIYHETNGVFKSFNGTMILSCVVAVIDDETGEMWYFNAEHPYTVLYRDGRACFIEEKLNLRKLGLDSEIDFQVFKYQLFPGDVVILGSDGRDDINLTPNDQIRTINEDETLFLKFVEEGKADIHQITELIKKAGEITDDLSFLRVGFKEITEDKPSTDENRHRTIAEETAHSGDSVTIDIDNDYPEEEENVEDYYHEAKKFLKEGNQEQALKELEAGYSRSHNNPKLNKLLALLSFKGKNYDTAVEVLGKYLEYDPDVADFWFYLSIAHKRLGKYESSLQAAEKFEALQPQNIQNLINLADLNRILGRIEDALAYQKKAIDLDPENRNAQKLAEILQKS